MSKFNEKGLHFTDTVKTVINIHKKLFDHTSFLENEINYFIDKTEKNKIDEEKILNKLKEDLNDYNSNEKVHIEQFINNELLNNLISKADELLNTSKLILNCEKLYEIKRENNLTENNCKIDEKRKEIQSKNNQKLLDLDNKLKLKKDDLTKYYHDLEEKWKKQNSY